MHGRVLVLEAFLFKLQLAREAPIVLKPLQNRILEASRRARWPALITGGLRSLIASMEKSLEVSSQKELGELAGAAGIRQSPSGQSSMQADVMRACYLQMTGADSRQSDSLWDRLYQTYVSTTNQPLKNELLPVLGRFSVSTKELPQTLLTLPLGESVVY